MARFLWLLRDGSGLVLDVNTRAAKPAVIRLWRL